MTLGPAFAGGHDGAAPMRAPDRKMRKTVSRSFISPTKGYHPIDVTAASAPNRLRQPVLVALREYGRWLGKLSGELFVGSDFRTTKVRRDLRAPRGYTKLVPHRRAFYDPPSYGESEDKGSGPRFLARAQGRRFR